MNTPPGFTIRSIPGDILTQNRALSGLLLVGLVLVAIATAGSASDIVVSGRVRHQAVLQVSNNAPTVYEITTERYIVEAGPVDVGIVVPLDNVLVASLCEDKDGCEVVLQYLNEFVSESGNVNSETAHLFLSQTSAWWQLSNDIRGQDDNDATGQWALEKCRFLDAEAYGGFSNGVSDTNLGFGLLNASGYGNDGSAICRVMLSD